MLYNIHLTKKYLLVLQVSDNVKMKSNRLTPLQRHLIIILMTVIAVFLPFLSGCEDEPVPRDYPRVRTLPVTNITQEGAVFTAEVYEPGNVEITEHGFVWALSKPDVNSDNRVYLGTFTGTGQFSAEVRTTFQEGITYNITAFIRAGEYTVYGETMKFKSLGSLGPEITGFSPERVLCGDTVLIRGKNFSWVKTFNEVYFNDIKGVVCDPVTDTTLYAVVPFTTVEPEKAITVEIAGNRTTYPAKKLLVDLPSAELIGSSSGCWGDTVNLKLQNLKSIDGLKIFFGPLIVSPYEPPHEGNISFIVPLESSVSENPVRVSTFVGDLVTSNPFILLPPVLDSISPSTGLWKDAVNLYGRFNTLRQDATIKFGTYAASVVYLSRDTITVTVPESLNLTPAEVTYSYKTMSTGPVLFKLRPPEILSVTPTSGMSGTIIRIKCRNVRTNFLSLRLNDIVLDPEYVTGQTYDDMTIETHVKGNFVGPALLSLTVCGQSDTLEQPFNVTNPRVVSFSPQTAVPGDTISVETENYADYITTFRFAGITGCLMPQVSRSGTISTVIYPDCWFSSGAIYTVNGFNMVTSVIPSDDILHQAVPRIESVEPLEARYNDEIIIRGSNFSKVLNYNHVSINGHNVILKSGSANELRFNMPDLVFGTYDVSLTVGGYSVAGPEPVMVISPWEKLPDLPFQNTITYSMKFGNEVLAAVSLPYEYYSKVIYRFDPASATFSRMNNIEYTNMLFWPGVVVKDTKAYLLAKWIVPQLQLFDRDKEEVSQVCDYPGRDYPETIILDGDSVLYMGGGYPDYSRYTLDFWKYNYSTGVWKKLNDLPETTCHSNEFTINGRCYIVTSANHLFEYSPVDDTWIPRASYPGVWSKYKVAVVSDGKVYMGFGERSALLHRYDPATDSWEAIRVPSGYFQNYCLSFSLNNKIYLSETGQGFWSYDPAKEQ
jgi:hypothetical protein